MDPARTGSGRADDVIARRPLAALAALALVTTLFAALACARRQSAAPPPPARPESEASLPAYAPTPPLTGGEEQFAAAAKLPDSAVVAVALVLDNKERCAPHRRPRQRAARRGAERALYDGHSLHRAAHRRRGRGPRRLPGHRRRGSRSSAEDRPRGRRRGAAKRRGSPSRPDGNLPPRDGPPQRPLPLRPRDQRRDRRVRPPGARPRPDPAAHRNRTAGRRAPPTSRSSAPP